MNTIRNTMAAGLGLASLLGVAYQVGSAQAAGIPTADPLVYRGRVTNGGAVLTGTHGIQVQIWNVESGGVTPVCQVGPTQKQFTDGTFSIALPVPQCSAAIHANPELWAEVFVNGGTTGRTKVSAVPFALESVAAGRYTGSSLGVNNTSPQEALHIGQSALLAPVWHDGNSAALKFNTYESPANTDKTVLQGNRAGALVLGNNGLDLLLSPTIGTAAGNPIADLRSVLTVDYSGHVGIGATPGNRPLTLGGDEVTLRLQGALNNNIEWTQIGSAVPAWIWGVRGDVGGNNNDFKLLRYGAGNFQDIALQVSGATGTVAVTGSLTVGGQTCACASDARLKKNVETLSNALADVRRLRGVRFDWTKDGKAAIGVIAQELEQVYPELVTTNQDGVKAVDYGKLAGVFIESTKTLAQENQEAQAHIRKLEGEQDVLRARLDRLERALAVTAQR